MIDYFDPIETRLDRRTLPEPNSGCWLWDGGYQGQGYGVLSMPGYAVELAHRASYKRHKGPIPDGLELDHLCRNPACINPDHLEPVTHAENSRRALRKKFCVNGHPLLGDNLICLSGKRDKQKRCKQCHRERMRRYSRS